MTPARATELCLTDNYIYQVSTDNNAAVQFRLQQPEAHREAAGHKPAGGLRRMPHVPTAANSVTDLHLQTHLHTVPHQASLVLHEDHAEIREIPEVYGGPEVLH